MKTRPETAAISSSTTTARRTRCAGCQGRASAGPPHRRVGAPAPAGTARRERCRPAPAAGRRQRQPSLAGQQRGHHRGQCHAQIAEDAIDADRAAGPGAGGLHQHRRADRVVDRGERPVTASATASIQRRGRQSRPAAIDSAGAEEEGRPSAASARSVPPASPCGRAAEAVEHEHAGRRAPGSARSRAPKARPAPRHGEHRRRQDQQRVMGETYGAALMKAICRLSGSCIRRSWPFLGVVCILVWPATDVRPSYVADPANSTTRPDSPRPQDAVTGRWSASPTTTAWARACRGIRMNASQLLYATRGIMRVATDAAGFMVPPGRALWLPGAVPHITAMPGPVAMRALFLRAERRRGPARPASPCWRSRRCCGS